MPTVSDAIGRSGEAVTKTEAWYVGQRAEALAMMYLTRRDDLAVTHPSLDYGIDLVVQLLENGVVSGRMFGVQVKATRSRDGLQRRMNAALQDVFAKQGGIISDLPFPVCLFFFALDTDVGYYAWLVEPAGEAGLLRAKASQAPEFRELNDESIGQIVADVRRWYATKHASQTSG
jgi:hypothetical protein